MTALAIGMSIAGFADAWAAAMWRASWQGAVALALAWVITRTFARVPPALKCWVWRLAYLKLLVALAWAAPVPLPLLPAPPPPAPALAAIPLANLRTSHADIAPAVSMPASAEAHAAPIATALLMAWAAGVGVVLARLVLGWRCVRALRRASAALDDPGLLRACADLAARYGLPRPPSLAHAAALASPLLLGPLRPLVVFPAGAAARHAPAELRLMLAHELAHLKRRDLWWNWLPALAQALFFFHPLVWLAGREWRLDQESACDEAALAAAGASPAQYGDMLLGVIAAPGVSLPRFSAPPATAAAGVVESPRTVRRRLTAMKHFPTAPRAARRSRLRRVLACAFVLTGLLAVVPWRVVAQQSAQESPSANDDAVKDDAVKDADGNEEEKEASEKSPAGPAEKLDDARPDARGPAPAERGYLKTAEVNLAAATDGIVAQVAAEAGEMVKQGQVLVRLNDRRAQLGLQVSRSKLEEAESKARRAKELHESKEIPEADLRQITAAREQARAELALREQELEETRALAPIDGALERVLVRPGEFVARGGVLARVVALKDFWAEVHVPQATAARLKPGEPATLRVRDSRRALKGKVRYVSNIVRSGSQTALVRVDVLDAPAGLKPGMEVTVDFERGQ